MAHLSLVSDTNNAAGEGSVPRYLDLASRLIAEIQGGRYPVGSQLLTEYELCALYGVSRFTVRAALESLRKKGYVTRRPKAGTVVVSSNPQVRYSVSVMGTADMLRLSRELSYRVISVDDVTADLALARDLECAPGESWIRLTGCRLTPQTELVVSLVDYYARPEQRSALPGVGISRKRGSIYSRIERATNEPVTEIRQEITGHSIRGDQARLLQVAEGTSAVRMVHKVVGADARRPLYAIVAIYPADRFSFTQTLKPEG